MTLIIKTSQISIESGSNKGDISGYASVFSYVDSHGDTIQKGAFQESIQRHRCGESIKLLWQHDQSQPIGYITDIYEDEYGLFINAKLLLDEINKAKEVYALIKTNSVNSLSIGFKVLNSFLDHQKSCRVITDLNLWEVSLVTFPANNKAKITHIKSQDTKILFNKIQKAIKILSSK